MKRQILISSLVFLFIAAATASATPPSPDPSQWSTKPMVLRLLPSPQVFMRAVTSTDAHSPVTYYFKCTDVNGTGPNPTFDSGWITSRIYTISSGLNVNSTYTFTVKTRDSLFNETGESIQASVTVNSQGANLLTVPVPYTTIQGAINAASNGDIVEVRPYPVYPHTYRGFGNYNINFRGKAIVVRSLDPNDPNTVAATVIDCNNWGRAFVFQTGEDHNSVLTGFTIINGSSVFDPNTPPPPPTSYSADGTNGLDAKGGAIACFTYAPDINTNKPSQPIIRNCVFKNCAARGEYGGDGQVGPPFGTPGANGNPNGNCGGQNGQTGGDGGNGGNGGYAYGGALYFESGSPEIIKCQIIGCAAVGGNAGPGANAGPGGSGGLGCNGRGGNTDIPNGSPGGNGGEGGRGGRGGDGGYGGEALGGAIYFNTVNGACQPKIIACDINDCYAINGLGNDGGNGGNGGIGGNGGGGGAGSGDGADGSGGSGRRGGDGGSGGFAGFDGVRSYAGAVYYEKQCQVTVVDTTIINNAVFINNGGFHSGGNGGNGGTGGDGGAGAGDALDGDCGDGGDGGPGSSGGTGGIGGQHGSRDPLQQCNPGWAGFSDPDFFGAVNITMLYGGADYYEKECAANITGCAISDNIASGRNYYETVGWGGGEYYEPNCASVFNYSKVEDNTAAVDGGGIHFNGGTLLGTSAFNFCDVSGNAAAWAGGGIRGGDDDVAPLGFAIDVCDSNFSGNDALFGGGIYLEESLLTMMDANISGSTAYEGAGVFGYNCTATAKGCTVRNNSAAFGGGFSFINGLITIQNSYLTGNDANASFYDGGIGGAIFLEGWSDYPHQLTNCLITNNTAYAYGGGLSNNRGSWVQIANCTFAGNRVIGSDSVGGGVSCEEHWAWVEIFNSIFWGNQAVTGGSQIAVGDPFGSYPYGSGPYADVDVSYSDVQGGEEGVWLEDPTQTYTVLWWFEGNIDKDPGFIGGYYLSQVFAGQEVDSPCLDSGNANANDPDIGLDTYTTRTDSVSDAGIVDMGYHYKLFIAPQYQLTAAAIPVFGLPGDQPDVTPDSGTYYQYTVVHLTVNAPPPGYQVLWTGTDNDTLTGTQNTVMMDRNKTVTVTFVKNVCNLTTSVIGSGGTVMPASGTYPRGTVVTLIATPYAGWRLKAWSGTDNDSSIATTITVTMNSDRTVAVEFEQLKTLIVVAGGGQSGYYSTIQDAVSDARNGDTVMVYPGTYYGAYEGLSFYLDKSITITSLHPDDPCFVAGTVIDGYNQSQFNQGFNNIGIIFGPSTDANTVFSGFTIRNCGGYFGDGQDGQRTPINHPNGYDGGSGVGAAIRIYGGGPIIKNCVIRDNLVLGGSGGTGTSATAPPDNFNAGRGGWGGFAWGGAVYCSVNSSPTFINCRIINNLARGGNGGIGGDDAFPGGEENYGGNWSIRGTPEFPVSDIDPYTSNMTPVTDADLWEVWNTYQDNPGYVGSYRWYSGVGGGVFIDEGSNVAFVGCEISGNHAKGGMSGQGGIDNLSQRPEEPLIPFEMPTFGGGVYCAAGSTVTFTDCTITDNISSEPNDPPNNQIDTYLGHGGGVCAEDTAKLIFTNCTFSRNDADAGGGLQFADADALISDCSFTSNLALQGGGLFGEHGPATIRRSIFTSNIAASDDDLGILGMGGGLHFWAANVNIIDCSISGNQADSSGGGVYLGGETNPLLNNCLFTNNTAGRDGGGLSANWYSSPLITNCTIVGNEATGDSGAFGERGLGGGIYSSYHSYSVVLNSILWNNHALKGNELAVGTGFEYDPRPSTVSVSYSDVKGGPAFVFTDLGCTLIWDVDISDPNYPTNKQVDPCFVTGPLGNYYLSQIDTNDPNQTADSPCVNTGNSLASDVGLSTPYTTRTDEVSDANIVDMGYHYPLAHPRDLCSFCDLSHDGEVNLVDFAVLANYWLDYNCNSSDANNWCGGADLTFDSYVNYEDEAVLNGCLLAKDTNAPLPNPSQWKISPYSTTTAPPFTISMTAETAYDDWGGVVEYYFECLTGNDSNSGWGPNTTYTTTGHLDSNVTFAYRVKARDERGHETQWSVIGYALTGQEQQQPQEEDLDTPRPDPMTWALVPAAAGSTSITMTATTADDNTPPVEYFFECTDHADINSGWQTGTTYTAAGLTPSTLYTFRVRARDGVTPQPNITGWSNTASATTTAVALPNLPPGVPGHPTGTVLWATTTPTPPYETGGTYDAFAHMSAQVAVDPEGAGVQYYFQCVDSDFSGIFSGTCGLAAVGYSSGWIDVPQWNVCMWRPGMALEFRFKVRDTSPAQVESGWSTTRPCYPPPP